MKKLAIYLFGLLIVSVLLGIKPVYAAECTADKNLYMATFNGSRESIDKALGVVQESSVSTSNVLFASMLSVANIGMTSSVGNCVNASVMDNIKDANANRDSGGALQFAVKLMTQSFMGVPAESIPDHYAQLLLPKEVVSGSTAFAVNCGDKGILTAPPGCSSASRYYGNDDKYGIGISNLWSVSFVFAMIMVTFVLVISGFMIMFRSKIGGQVVVTISMALQNVVIAAGMALASYALGVFFVNLSKFLILLFANLFLAVIASQDRDMAILFGGELFSIGSVSVDSPVAFMTFINEPLGLAAKLLLVLLVGDLGGALSTLGSSFGFPDALTLPAIVSTTLSNLLGVVTTGFILAGFGLIGLISRLIITGGVFIGSIRIFWTVLKIYIKMVIDIIAAPVLFVLMAIPGKNTGISDWISRMFKNALGPPLIFLAVNLTIYITLKLAFGAADSSVTGGPVTAVSGGSLSGGLSEGTVLSFFWGMMSVGMGLHGIVMLVLLNMIPSIPKALEDLFAAKSSGSLAKAGEEVGKRLQSIPLMGSLMK